MYTINDIDFTRPYEVYLWKSNKCKPKLFYPESMVESQVFQLIHPFVTEGYLFDCERGVSFSIKYVDGQYLVY